MLPVDAETIHQSKKYLVYNRLRFVIIHVVYIVNVLLYVDWNIGLTFVENVSVKERIRWQPQKRS